MQEINSLTRSDVVWAALALKARRALVTASVVAVFVIVHIIDFSAVYAGSSEAVSVSSAAFSDLRQDTPADVTVIDESMLQRILAADGKAGEGFGSGIKTLPGYLFVGAAAADVLGAEDRGAVYVFERSGGKWNQSQKLLAPDGKAGDSFGDSLEVRDDRLYVGASYADVGGNADQGAVYVFRRGSSGWSYLNKIVLGSGVSGDRFGVSLAHDGTALFVGSHRRDVNSRIDQGTVYIFTATSSGWQQRATLTASDGAAADEFGWQLLRFDNVLVVSANHKTVGGNTEQGVIYVFTGSGVSWTQRARLTSSDSQTDAEFGKSLAGRTGLILVGAHRMAVDGKTLQGAVYVFEGSNASWTQARRLTASDGAAYDMFGVSLALDGNRLFVGAVGDNVGSVDDIGSVYVFNRGSTGSWTQQQKLTPASGVTRDRTGNYIHVESGSIYAAASYATISGRADQGAVYLYSNCYRLTLSSTGSGAIPVANPGNSSGCSAGYYIPDESLQLTASPSSGWRVASWSGTGANSSTSTSNSVTMPAGNHTVTVNYEAIPDPCYLLTLTHTGSGSDPVATPGSSAGCASGRYVAGASISLTASPSSGWRVASWSGTVANSSTSTSNSVTMPAAGHTVTVNYENVPPTCYTLMLTHTGSGGDPVATPGSSTGCASGRYVAGASITLAASPASGWRVASWSGTNADSSTSTTNSVTMPAAGHTVTVNYENVPPTCYTLTLTHTGSGSDPVATQGSSTGCASGRYVAGQSITLTASPASGWQVASWSGTVANGSTSTSNSVTMPAGSHTVTVLYIPSATTTQFGTFLPLLVWDPSTVQPFPTLQNGDFDSPNDASWMQQSIHYPNLIVSSQDVNDTEVEGFFAHSEPNVAWLGGKDSELASLAQIVDLPTNHENIRLSFMHWIGSKESTCGDDQAYVEVNGVMLSNTNLCQNDNTGGWKPKHVDLSGYVGQQITIRFRVDLNDSEVSNWFLDSVVLCDGTQEHPCN